MNKIIKSTLMVAILGIGIGSITQAQIFAQEYSGTLDIYVEGANAGHEYSLCGGELHELNIGCLNFKGQEFIEGYVGEFAYNGDTKVKVYGCAIDETADKFSCDSFWASPITKMKTMTLVVNQDSIIPLPSQMSESTQLSQASDSNNNDETTSWTDPKTGLTYDIPMGEYCLDFDGDSICDVDFNDGKMVVYEEDNNDNDNGNGNNDNDDNKRPPSDNPYCDQVTVYESCFDRKDYDQETGLYPCKDGSNVKDWRDCNGDSGGSNNDDSAAEDNLPEDGGCQGSDDYCDRDEGCRSESVDCIDDRNFDEDDYNG